MECGKQNSKLAFCKYQYAQWPEISTAIECPLAINAEAREAVHDYYQEMLQAKQYTKAITLLAYGLPSRECIWWGYVGLADHNQTQSPDYDAVAAWVRNPNEMQLKKCVALSLATGQAQTPIDWLLMAVSLQTDNINLPGEPAIVAPQFMSAQATVNALIITAEHADDKAQAYQHILLRGQHIAAGGNGLITLATVERKD